MYFGTVGVQLANKIKAATKYDFTNKNVSLRADNVRKVSKHSHGNEEKENSKDQRAVTPDDYIKIPDAISEPDKIIPSKYRGQPAAIFEKTYGNERVRIIAVDSGGSSLELFVQTMYINKKSGSLANAPDANSPGSTSETPVGTTPIDNIAQSSKESNTSEEKNPDAVDWEGNREQRLSVSEDDDGIDLSRYSGKDRVYMEAVTRDDNGDPVDLSERFRTDRSGEEAWKNRDIRFSPSEDAGDSWGVDWIGKENGSEERGSTSSASRSEAPSPQGEGLETGETDSSPAAQNDKTGERIATAPEAPRNDNEENYGGTRTAECRPYRRNADGRVPSPQAGTPDPSSLPPP